MKTKNKKFLILSILTIIIILSILNINVTYQEGINYQTYTIRIPLYFKILGFFDRHFNYDLLVKGIIESAKTDEERVMKIFEWTYNNIRKVPKGFPIVDDHVLNIIIRGYGTDDQSADVFSTLCNYAGVDVFFTWLNTKDNKSRRAFSFVKLGNRWSMFDPYNGVYFKNKRGQVASLDELLRGEWECVGLKGEVVTTNYEDFFYALNSINYKNFMFSRSAIQSPLRRFFYWLKSRFRFFV